MKEKTLIEIWRDDVKDVHLLKISTNAKNLPEVLHKAIQLLKKQIKEELGK